MRHTNHFLPILIIAIISPLTGCATAPTAPTLTPREVAINAIRTVLELPYLPLTYVETTQMGNSPSGTLRVERYDDSEGRKFYIDPQTNQVVEIDARSRLSVISPDTPALSDDALLEKAEKIAELVIPNYTTAVAGLTYEANNKGDNYFYDWRDMSQPVVSMPPFVQIGLHVSGELFAYYNTLSVK